MNALHRRLCGLLLSLAGVATIGVLAGEPLTAAICGADEGCVSTKLAWTTDCVHQVHSRRTTESWPPVGQCFDLVASSPPCWEFPSLETDPYAQDREYIWLRSAHPGEHHLQASFCIKHR